MDVGNAPAACSWASLPEFLRRVAAGKLNLVRSYPVQEEHVTSASLSRRRWRAGVRRDETRVSTIEGSRDAAGPHPIYLVDSAGSRTHVPAGAGTSRAR